MDQKWKGAFVSKFLPWTAVMQRTVYLSSTLEFENSSMHSKQLLFILVGHDQFFLYFPILSSSNVKFMNSLSIE